MALLKGSKFSYLVVFAGNFIGFLAGTALSWSSPMLPKLESNNTDITPLGRSITDNEKSWIASLSALGGILGPLIYVFLVDLLGRKLTVTALAVPYLIAYALAAFAKDVALYYAARILMGIGIGAAFTIMPIYIVEVSEDVNRGILCASTTSFIMIGSLFTYILGPYVSVFAFNLVLTILCVAFIPLWWLFAPETPFYLLKKNQRSEALESLRFLRRRSSKELEEELCKIELHLNNNQQGSLMDLFKTKAARKAFGMSVALTTFQQFSGIIVIMFYTQNIFDATGSKIAPEICSIILGLVQVLCCLNTPLTTDRFGRRRLLLVSIAGATLSEVFMGVYFYLQENGRDVSSLGWMPVVCLVGYIFFYQWGMGALPWSIMAEITPSSVITVCSSLTASTYWVSGFFLTYYFSAISEGITLAGCFWLFAGFCVLWEIFVYVFVFETKGKSLQEIQDILNK